MCEDMCGWRGEHVSVVKGGNVKTNPGFELRCK